MQNFFVPESKKKEFQFTVTKERCGQKEQRIYHIEQEGDKFKATDITNIRIDKNNTILSQKETDDLFSAIHAVTSPPKDIKKNEDGEELAPTSKCGSPYYWWV